MRHLAFVLSLFIAPTLLPQSSSIYRISHTCTLGGDGSWDYASLIHHSIACSSAAGSRHGQRLSQRTE